MLVDAVTEVLMIDNKQPLDQRTNKEGSRFLSGIGNMDGRLIIMLNLEEIVGIPKDAK